MQIHIKMRPKDKNMFKKICEFSTKHMAAIILGVAVMALFIPKTALWVQTSWINNLLMLVMFGMGLTLNPTDFLMVLKRPKEILIGGIAQFTVMPILAFMLGKLFGLDTALLAGVVLVGTCPGGTASNVMTYLAKGDVALSVGMTSINTLLAPVLTPLITYLFLRTSVDMDIWAMFFSIIKVVIVPIGLGLFMTKLWGKLTQKASVYLPFISVVAIALIIAAVVSHNAERILKTGFVIFAVVILHNLLGYVAGFSIASFLHMKTSQKKAMSMEIGMQNSGLATSLAMTSFPNLAMATVPGAIFSVWHNISGGILASVFRKWNGK